MSELTEISGIKSWAENDRPREKLLSKGRQALTDAELIAILIGSGSKNISAVELSQKILRAYDDKLSSLGRVSISDLQRFKGIGEAKAISIIAALELGRRRREEAGLEMKSISSSKTVYEMLSATLADIDHEEFWILLLSRNNKVKDKICISRGGIAGTVVDQRLIFKPAIEKLASYIILCHNHPSGNLKPSQEDKLLTQKLVVSGGQLGIPIVDHIIYTDNGYFSFADEGLI